MKKLLALILALSALFSLAACGEAPEKAVDPEYCEECSKEKLLELLDDPDPVLRAEAAAACGRFEDLDFLPKLEEILNAPNENGLHAAALKSLIKLWYDAPRYENFYEEAFVLYKDYLKHEPGQELPDIEAFAPFQEKVHEKWLLAASWFNRDELVEELQVILADPGCEGEYKEAVEKAVKVLNAIQASLPGGCNLTW